MGKRLLKEETDEGVEAVKDVVTGMASLAKSWPLMSAMSKG